EARQAVRVSPQRPERSRARSRTPPGTAAAPAARWWRAAGRGATRRAPRHHVYVIEPDPAALTHAKFRAANPNHDPRKPPLYVGMTGLDPETRFERHK